MCVREVEGGGMGEVGVQGLRFRAQDLGERSGFRVQERLQGSGFRREVRAQGVGKALAPLERAPPQPRPTRQTLLVQGYLAHKRTLPAGTLP